MTVSESNKVLNGMEVRTVVKVRMLDSEGHPSGFGAADPIEGDSLEDLIKRVEALEARNDRDHDELPHVDDSGNVLGETVDGGGGQLVTKR